jgi:RNA polymerase sigma factor (sigma-70 family)
MTTSIVGTSKHGESQFLTAAHDCAFRWAKTRTDYDSACDLASHVTEIVWRRRRDDPSFLGNGDELRKFVAAATRNALADVRRSTRRRTRRQAVFERESREQQHSWMSPHDESSYTELLRTVDWVLARTSAGVRDAFRLVCVEGLTYSSAAVRLGVSPKAVTLRVRRGQMCVRRALPDYPNLRGAA